MNSDDFNTFLTKRYYPQIAWYNRKARRYKRMHIASQWCISLITPTVPALIVKLPPDHSVVATVLSILLAICTMLLKAFKVQENWINYRSIAESLTKEESFYRAKLYNYDAAKDPESFFVERVESMISSENSLWQTTHRQQGESHGK